MQGDEDGDGLEKEAAEGKEEVLKGLTDILLWKRPHFTLLLLLSACLTYYHLVFRYHGLVPFVAELLLVLTCAAGVLKVLAKQFDISVADVPAFEVSEATSVCIAASAVNTIGAAEGVLRGAANGQDWKLFCKVCISLYIASVLGRIASGATVVFLGVWLFFILPPLYGVFSLSGLSNEAYTRDLSMRKIEDVEEVLLPALSRITTPRPSMQ